MQATKALLGAVIVMGVLIVLGTAVVISEVVRRALHTVQPAPVAALASPLPAAGTLGEPAGTRIITVVRQSDSLLDLVLSGGGADRIVVWDIPQGRVAGRLSLGQAVARRPELQR